MKTPAGLRPRRGFPGQILTRDLDRVLERHDDGVRGLWEERFERRCRSWRGVVDEAVRRSVGRGLFENGSARVGCPDRADEYLPAFSCTMRELCPSCAAKRSAATAAVPPEEVLKEIMWASPFGPLQALVMTIVADARPVRGQKSR